MILVITESDPDYVAKAKNVARMAEEARLMVSEGHEKDTVTAGRNDEEDHPIWASIFTFVGERLGEMHETYPGLHVDGYIPDTSYREDALGMARKCEQYGEHARRIVKNYYEAIDPGGRSLRWSQE